MTNFTFFTLTLVALVALIYRVFLGVDFGDESFHLTVAHHFILGAKAFQDESSIRQIFAFFTLPLVKGLHFFNPSNLSLVFYMRLCFLLFHFGFCMLVRKTLQSFAPTSRTSIDLAFLASLFFIPANDFSLHYATLGFMFLGASLCLDFFSNEKQVENLSFLSGLVMGCATACHPGTFISTPFLLLSKKEKKWPKTLGFLSLWLLLMFFFNFTPVDYLNSVISTKESIRQSGVELGSGKFLEMVTSLSPKGPFILALIFWVISFVLLTRTKAKVWLLGNLFLFPVITFFNCRASQGGLGSPGYVLCLSYFSPILCWYIFGRATTEKYLLRFFLPCFLAFIGCSFLSCGGVAGTSGALITVLPFSLFFLSEASKKELLTQNSFKQEIIFAIPSLLFLFFFIRGTFASVYQEDTLRYTLSSEITSGPFKSLKTSVAKKNLIESLEKDLASLPVKRGRIVFSCFFPAGYLLTNFFPNHHFPWEAPPLTQIKPNTDIVVRIFDETYPKINVWPQHCEALSETIAGQKGTIIKKQDYEIWVKNESFGSNFEKQL